MFKDPWRFVSTGVPVDPACPRCGSQRTVPGRLTAGDGPRAYFRPDEFKLVVKGAGRDVTQQYAVA